MNTTTGIRRTLAAHRDKSSFYRPSGNSAELIARAMEQAARLRIQAYKASQIMVKGFK